MQIAGALELFLKELKADGRSHHTIQQYRRHVRTLAAWAAEVGHSGRAGEISAEDVAAFLASPQARTSARGGKKKRSSVACLRRSVEAFLRYVEKEGTVHTGRVATMRTPSKGPTSAVTPHLDLGGCPGIGRVSSDKLFRPFGRHHG